MRRVGPGLRPAVALSLFALTLAATACAGGHRAAAPATTAMTSTLPVLPDPTTAVAPTTSTAPSAPGCPTVPARAAPDPNRPRYRVTADVDAATATASGTEEVRFTPDLPTDRLVLRLWPNGPVPAAKGGHLTTGPISIDGAVRPSTSPDATTVVVPGALAAGRTVTITLKWALAIPRNLSERWSVSGGAVRLASFVPLLPWEPGNGWDVEAPTLVHGEATTTPVADWNVDVDAHGLDVLATGVNDRPGHWAATAARDFALSAARFTLRSATVAAPGPVAVTVGVAAGVAEDPQTYLSKVAAVLRSFAARFGPYPFPAYALAITPGLQGGVEDPMLTMQGPGTISRTTSHEIGHMWFYALVGNDQARDPWLDEGLASWAEAGYERSLPSFVSRFVPADAKGQAGRPVSFWDGHAASYYRGVYVQPVQALARLGPPAVVDCALAAYVAEQAWRIARPADLLRVLGATFPDAATAFAGVGIPA